jgi:mannose-6-phosphate isomerase
VHPDDAYARRHENSPGKSEAWIVLHSEPDGYVYRGFREGSTLSDFDRLLAEGRVEEILHRVDVSAGDCIDLPARTVHAIGPGLLICEIQQSSDVTYRIYDWNRLGDDGKPRSLHVDRARDVMDFSDGSPSKVVPSPVPIEGGTREILVDSDNFALERLNVHSETEVNHLRGRFHILCILNGAGSLAFEDDSMPLKAGDSILVPACMNDYRLIPIKIKNLTAAIAHLPA